MNRIEAMVLSEVVTLDELKEMFRNAQNNIEDWERMSRINKGMTIGAAYNILSFEPDKYSSIKDINTLGIINMIWEFGEYLPGYEKPSSKPRPDRSTVIHQEPKFKF